MTVEADRNLEALRANPYPGRGIIVGMDTEGANLVQAYWIMGRSPNSRNRVFEQEPGRLWTAAADPAKVKDPSLIIYNAMVENGGNYIVTNGDQTDTILQADRVGTDFRAALNVREYEPDAPNYTPRISGVCSLRHDAPAAELAVLKRSAPTGGCDRHHFRYESFAPGLGWCVTTYLADGDPLPSFAGEPYLLPLSGTQADLTQTLWQALDEDNRVSLAVKFIPLAGGESETVIVNKYEKVG